MAGCLSRLIAELDGEIAMNGLNVNREDLEGLPAELLAQLKVETSKSKIEERRLLDCIAKLGGEVVIDKLMIRYWHDYNSVLDRSATLQRLGRMIKKRLVFSHPKNKGVYGIKAY